MAETFMVRCKGVTCQVHVTDDWILDNPALDEASVREHIITSARLCPDFDKVMSESPNAKVEIVNLYPPSIRMGVGRGMLIIKEEL